MGLWVLKLHVLFFYCLWPDRQKLQHRVKANPISFKDIFPTRWNKNILWPCLVVCLCWCISWNLFFNKSLITLLSSNKRFPKLVCFFLKVFWQIFIFCLSIEFEFFILFFLLSDSRDPRLDGLEVIWSSSFSI